MRGNFKIRNVSEWLKLSALPVPKIPDENSKGATYNVLKVGFFLADISDCKKYGVSDFPIKEGRCPLPTIVVKSEEGEKKFYRLPLGLNEWAHSTVAMVQMMGQSFFPCNVEFGILNDREYAEML